MLLVRHASYFVLGAMLAIVVETVENKHKVKYTDWFLLVTALVYCTGISFVALPPYFMPNPLDDYIIAIAHPLIFFLVVFGIYISKYLQSKKVRTWCGVLGGITYPLYLLHQTIGRVVIDYFKDDASLLVRGTYMFAVMLIVSYVVSLIDKQLRYTLRKKFNLIRE
jgi:peptidoglycan/LPS O-acetylase OafA/YrhL